MARQFEPSPACRGLAARFATDQSANVAMIFGIALLPTITMIGMAVDYTRGVTERIRLQQAVDATALALAHEAKTASQAHLQAVADRFFAGVITTRDGPNPGVTVRKTEDSISVQTSKTVPTTIMRLAGQETMSVRASAVAAFATRQVEIALVLDNTGSMGWSGKMDALKSAATNFLDQLAQNRSRAGEIRVSLVPYATQVNVGTAQAGQSWLDMTTFAPWGWDGCVADRNQNFDVNADAGAPYPAQNCMAPTSPLSPLTDLAVSADLTSLKNAVNGMTAYGATNITIGLVWGLATLSPHGPFAGAQPFAKKHVDKFIVLLTDGDNTQSRYATDKVALDNRMRMACDAAKDPAKRIRLFTIRVIDGDANLLRTCASSPSDYYEAADSSQIQPAFTAILNAILDVRLTN